MHVIPVSIIPITERSSNAVVWGHVQSAWGPCVVAGHEGDICWLDIAPGESATERVREHFMSCELQRNDEFARALLDASAAAISRDTDLRLKVVGTEFQRQVWQALADTRAGDRLSYGELAKAIGRPGAARAVGSAAAANVIALLIPCHRLVPASGQSGAYRWGAALKQKLLAAERQAA